jgi:hypothetical protein
LSNCTVLEKGTTSSCNDQRDLLLITDSFWLKCQTSNENLSYMARSKNLYILCVEVIVCNYDCLKNRNCQFFVDGTDVSYQ